MRVICDTLAKSAFPFQNYSQVNKLISLDDYIKQCKKQPKKNLKSQKEKKRWIKANFPDVSIVKHPQSGRDCVPVEQDMMMLVGSRTSSSRIKEERFEDKKAAKTSFAKAKEALQVQTNSKDRVTVKFD